MKNRCESGEDMLELHGAWKAAFEREFARADEINKTSNRCNKYNINHEMFEQLRARVLAEYNGTHEIYPPIGDVFNAFELTPLESVKCVILGQDPYHEPGQAHGLSFSVRPGVRIPPSLANIYKELQEDCGCFIPDNGYLEKWARQGVLLLNTCMTVRAHEANSHSEHSKTGSVMGWEAFTDTAIRILNDLSTPIVFMLWGAPAQKKKRLLDNPIHLVLETSHPSPLSVYRGFAGCRHFSRANAFLRENGRGEIDWQIENLG